MVLLNMNFINLFFIIFISLNLFANELFLRNSIAPKSDKQIIQDYVLLLEYCAGKLALKKDGANTGNKNTEDWISELRRTLIFYSTDKQIAFLQRLQTQ